MPIALGVLYGEANPAPKIPRLIPVTSSMADSLKRTVPGIVELDVKKDNSYRAMFYAPKGEDNKGGGCTADSLEVLCRKIIEKIPQQKVDGKGKVFNIVYRQPPRSPDTLTTKQILNLVECLGLDSAFYFKPQSSTDYLF